MMMMINYYISLINVHRIALLWVSTFSYTWCAGLKPTENNEAGYFWQITDIHYDANFSEAGDTNKMCHDSQTGNRHPQSIFGDYSCDAPWKLLVSTVQFMKSRTEPIDFILWTGDSIPHISTSQHNWQKVDQVMHNVSVLLRQEFPHTDLYPSLGNHDSWPNMQVPCCEAGHQYYDDVLHKWKWIEFLDNETATSFQWAGYYKKEIEDSLLLVNLNSILWYKHNNLFPNVEDPAGHFAWLTDTLLEARKAQQKVYVMTHIPPGYYSRTAYDIWIPAMYNKRLVDVLSAFSDIIVASFFGHEHTDAFRVIQGKDGSFPLFLAPGVAPLKFDTANNPSVRLYKYDKKTFKVLDYFQFYTDLSTIKGDQVPQWKLEYKLTEAFDIPDGTGFHMQHVADLVIKGFTNVVEKIVRYNSVSYHKHEDCDSQCRKVYYCSFVALTEETYRTCLETKYTPDHTHTATDRNTESFVDEHKLTQSTPAWLVVLLGILAVVGLVVGIGCFVHFRRPRVVSIDHVEYRKLEDMQVDGYMSSDSEDVGL